MKKLSYLLVFTALCLISTNTFAQEEKIEEAVQETVDVPETEEAITPEIEIEQVTETTEVKDAVQAKKEEEVEEAAEEVKNPE